MESLGKFTGWLMLLIVSYIVRGYSVSWLWLWFIVPISGWQPLTIPQSLGLSLMINALTYHVPIAKSDPPNEKSGAELLVWGICLSVIFLVTGYLLHLLLF